MSRRAVAIEWLLILFAVSMFGRASLLDFNDQQLPQIGEHNESATLPILAEIGLRRYGEIPLWNPYMLTGFPHAGDLVNHFWNPVATIPAVLFGGVNGMKVSVFLSFLAAALGQWFLAHTFGARGAFRLWAGLTFAFSGGLALLWRLGWYELLVGAVWFPWCFALLWRALHRRDGRSLALAALSIALIVTTGGGYYPLYLALTLVPLTLAALYFHEPAERGRQLRRAVAIATLGVALSAVYLLPLADGLRYTGRDAPGDPNQIYAQAIPYALFNYVVSDPSWFTTPALNRGSGYSWSYIGVLPLLALALAPWLFARFSWRRRGLLTLFFLLLVMLLWQANRNLPVRILYDWFPFLFTFRFPNRLLIIAAAPLIALAAVCMQGFLVALRRGQRGLKLTGAAPDVSTNVPGLPVVAAFNVVAVLVLLLALINLYLVNKDFGIHPHPRLANAGETLGLLRAADPELYYIDIGGDHPAWSWMAYAYELEMPVINFRYNRRVLSMDEQMGPESPFLALPKYVLRGESEEGPPGGVLLLNHKGTNVWRVPGVLPYAFSLQSRDTPAMPQTARKQVVRLDGPNRVIVEGAAEATSNHLVVLVSDYPGWRLRVDGSPAEVLPVNGYLGAAMRPGAHTYVFEFRPPLHSIGLAASLVALLLCLWLLVWGGRPRPEGASLWAGPYR